MKLRISTEEENLLTIIGDLRTCGHTGLAESIEQALSSYHSSADKKQKEQQTRIANPWDK